MPRVAATPNNGPVYSSLGGVILQQSGVVLAPPGQNSASFGPNEPRSNLPFDPRIARANMKDLPQVTGGVITSAIPGVNSQLAGLNQAPLNPPPFYCFFLFNPASIDANYSFDLTQSGTLPLSSDNPATWSTGAGGVLTQTISFNILFDRTYEVWNGPKAIPASAKYGFAQYQVGAPLNGGPYRFGVLWDVWSLERLCGIYRQAEGQQPINPPIPRIVHVMTGGVAEANALTGASTSAANQYTQIEEPATPISLDFYGWMTQFSVQYTRFDSNMTPTRCAVALSFQQTYVNQALNSNPGASNASPAPAPLPDATRSQLPNYMGPLPG